MTAAEAGGWGPEDAGVVRDPATLVRPAASLILASPSANGWRFLMGQRSAAQVFLPGCFVFPGGRMEAQDRPLVPSPLDERDADRIATVGGTQVTQRIAHRLAACALRETREETGFDLAASGISLRYLARAITPPGTVRRYDTRFFIGIVRDPVTAQRAAHDLPDGELEGIGWYRPDDIPTDRMIRITRIILGHALERVVTDPQLTAMHPVPCHRFVHGKPVLKYE